MSVEIITTVTENNQSLVNEFLKYMASDRGCRQKTVKAYDSDLRDFIQFDRSLPVLKYSEDDIRNYKFQLVSKGLAPRTVNRRLSCINSFFEFFCSKDNSEIVRNPAKKIPKMKVPKKIPIVLSVNQAFTFLNGILLTGRFGLRDYAIFSTFLFSAMRVSEVIRLKVHDVDFDKGVILVKDAKGGKDRLIPLIPELAVTLQMYLNNETTVEEIPIKLKHKTKMKIRVKKFKCGRKFFLNRSEEDDGTMFLNREGKKFTDKGVDYLFKKYMNKLGLYREGLSLHALRRSCLTFLHSQGEDLYTLREISGHAHIQTLEHYLAINANRVTAAMLKHPLATQGVDWGLVDIVRRDEKLSAMAK